MAKITSSILGEGPRGRVGNLIYQRGADGSTIVRQYTPPKTTRTPEQDKQRIALSRIGAAFKLLTPTEYAAWQAFAQKMAVWDAAAGRWTVPRPYNVYSGLGLKRLQIDPAATLPTLPPAQVFTGDGVTVTAAAGAGQIVFTASGANSAGIVTELMVQPLASANRKPQPRRYRPGAFIAFAAGSLSHSVAVEAGHFACAFRFVEAATGQASPMMVLETVRV